MKAYWTNYDWTNYESSVLGRDHESSAVLSTMVWSWMRASRTSYESSAVCMLQATVFKAQNNYHSQISYVFLLLGDVGVHL